MWENTPYDPDVPPLEESTSSGVPWDLYQDGPDDAEESDVERDYDVPPEPSDEDVVEAQSLRWLDRTRGK